ncbi:MAG: TIGR01459 family HAD-type hydrolase [Pseudomonadota bacterium]
MTRIIASLDEIAAGYDALLVDLWGCYHNGLEPYPAAVAALRRYRAAGGLVILLTNAPRPAAGVARFLAGIGAPEDTHDGIMSSGEACQRSMRSGRYGRRFHYVGPDRDLGMLAEIGLAPAPVEEAEAILLVGLFDDATETPEDYDPQIAAWRARALPVLCANPDIIVDRGTERLWCAGAIAQRYEQAGGPVVWYGKPHPPSYEAAFALLDEVAGRAVPRARVLAIGDGIHTDVAGGHAQSVDALFITGGIAAEAMGSDIENPDPDRLAAFCAAEGQTPRFAMGRFR